MLHLIIAPSFVLNTLLIIATNETYVAYTKDPVPTFRHFDKHGTVVNTFKLHKYCENVNYQMCYDRSVVAILSSKKNKQRDLVLWNLKNDRKL